MFSKVNETFRSPGMRFILCKNIKGQRQGQKIDEIADVVLCSQATSMKLYPKKTIVIVMENVYHTKSKTEQKHEEDVADP